MKKIIDKIYKLYMRKKFIKYIKVILSVVDTDEYFEFLRILGIYHDIEKFVDYYKLDHARKSIQLQIDGKNIILELCDKEIHINFTDNNQYYIKMKQIDRKFIYIIYKELGKVYKESIKIKNECNKQSIDCIRNVKDLPKDSVFVFKKGDCYENNR